MAKDWEGRDNASDLSGRSARDQGLAVAKVRIVVEVLLARMALRADTGAGGAGAPGSFGAGIRINELREVVVPSRTVTWRTKV
jgi:hypothetical protein